MLQSLNIMIVGRNIWDANEKSGSGDATLLYDTELV